MGLDADWAYNVVSQVGNYAELFDRNLKPLGIKRGLNALWRNGGLHYAPPIR
jgi:general L-amino acid transport system substrate-binding protein